VSEGVPDVSGLLASIHPIASSVYPISIVSGKIKIVSRYDLKGG